MPLAPLVSSAFVLAASLSLLITAVWIAYARRRGLLDAPGARRVHAQPTPRGGGVGIALLSAVCWLWLGRSLPGESSLQWLGLGLLLFALVGLADDLKPAPALPKFLGQLVAAAVLCLGQAELQGWVLALTILAAAYWVNVVNFMDGSNGLIGLQGLVLGLVLALWPGQDLPTVVAACVLAGACAGFLPFNMPAAKVFLGDVGSHAIGAATFALLLLSWQRGSLPFLSALTLASPVLLDTGLTLFRRLRAGRRPWQAHREHLYQYAVRRGLGHGGVAWTYALWTLAASLMALAGLNLRSSLVMWAAFILNIAGGTAAYWLLRRRWLAQARKQGRWVGE